MFRKEVRHKVIPEDAISELRAICAGAQEMVEAAFTYVYLPELRLPCVPTIVEPLHRRRREESLHNSRWQARSHPPDRGRRSANRDAPRGNPGFEMGKHRL